eukprot:3846755-Rhodomonas_salina.1
MNKVKVPLSWRIITHTFEWLCKLLSAASKHAGCCYLLGPAAFKLVLLRTRQRRDAETALYISDSYQNKSNAWQYSTSAPSSVSPSNFTYPPPAMGIISEDCLWTTTTWPASWAVMTMSKRALVSLWAWMTARKASLSSLSDGLTTTVFFFYGDSSDDSYVTALRSIFKSPQQ